MSIHILKTTPQNFLKTLYNFSVKNSFNYKLKYGSKSAWGYKESIFRAQASTNMSKILFEKSILLKKLQDFFIKSYKNNPMLVCLKHVETVEKTTIKSDVFLIKCDVTKYEIYFFVRLNETESLFLTMLPILKIPTFYYRNSYKYFTKTKTKRLGRKEELDAIKQVTEYLVDRINSNLNIKLIPVKVPTAIFDRLSEINHINLENFLEMIKEVEEEIKKKITNFLLKNRKDFIKFLAKEILEIMGINEYVIKLPNEFLIIGDYHTHRKDFIINLENTILNIVEKEAQNIIDKEELKKITNSFTLQGVLNDIFTEVFRKLNLEEEIFEQVLEDIVNFSFEYYELNDYKKIILSHYEKIKSYNYSYFLYLLNNSDYKSLKKDFLNSIQAINAINELITSILKEKFPNEIENRHDINYLGFSENIGLKDILELFENALGKEKILEEITMALDKLNNKPIKDTIEELLKKRIKYKVKYVLSGLIRLIKENAAKDFIQRYSTS